MTEVYAQLGFNACSWYLDEGSISKIIIDPVRWIPYPLLSMPTKVSRDSYGDAHPISVDLSANCRKKHDDRLPFSTDEHAVEETQHSQQKLFWPSTCKEARTLCRVATEFARDE